MNGSTFLGVFLIVIGAALIVIAARGRAGRVLTALQSGTTRTTTGNAAPGNTGVHPTTINTRPGRSA